MFLWTDLLFLLFVCTTTCSWEPLEDQADILVKTQLGTIRGSLMVSQKNQDFYAFRGIPYAEPPIGARRFRSPVPLKSWNGILDATKDGFICPQLTYNSTIKNLLSEDCLLLNIFTKTLNTSLPVLVYIHGGGYVQGGSHSEIFWGPQYLMDKEIVLVTINYRLGPLGFLSTGTEDASGNYGLKDQVIALRWIRDNIKEFGGDPNTVTLWGHSAGAICVTLHLVSPMSQGLFHRIIAMSGSTTSHIIPQNQDLTKKIAEQLGCLRNCSKLLVECLRAKPYDVITDVIASWTKPDVTRLLWNYEIEEEVFNGQERFIHENPSSLYARGKFSKIPILTGITKDEFGLNAYQIFNNTKLLGEFNNNFNSIAPEAFMYNSSLTYVSQSLRSVYLQNKEITGENLEQFGEIIADAVIMHGVHRFVELARRFTDVYYYLQSYMGRFSFFTGSNGKPLGVYHSDDLLYLFVHKSRGPMFKKNDPENFMVERLSELWTTFARTGKPKDNNKSINWEPSNRYNTKVLHINKDCIVSPEEPYSERFKLWDKLFPV